jgi:hypothetical protein
MSAGCLGFAANCFVKVETFGLRLFGLRLPNGRKIRFAKMKNILMKQMR